MKTEQEQIEIAKLYENGINSLELGKRFNIRPSTAVYYVRKYGGTIRNAHSTALKYYFNENCWDKKLATETTS